MQCKTVRRAFANLRSSCRQHYGFCLVSVFNKLDFTIRSDSDVFDHYRFSANASEATTRATIGARLAKISRCDAAISIATSGTGSTVFGAITGAAKRSRLACRVDANTRTTIAVSRAFSVVLLAARPVLASTGAAVCASAACERDVLAALTVTTEQT